MNVSTHKMFLSLGLAGAVLFGALSQAQATANQAPAADPKAKRAELRKMCDDALATVYKAQPAAKAVVAKSAGYGCFTSFGMSFFVGGAGGQGLVHSNKSKKDTYMNMVQAGGGFDFGIKQYREVLVFKDAKTLDQFVNKGWQLGGTVMAAAAADGKGGAATDTQIGDGAIQVYPLTDTGLAVGMSVAGRKYWKDEALNAAK